MTQKIKLLGVLGLIVLFGIACQNSGKKEELPAGNHKALITEVIQASNYTYVHVTENGEEYWIAVNKQILEKGDVVYHLGGLEMPYFESKELERSFDKILFISELSFEPIEETRQMVNGHDKPLKPQIERIDVVIEKPDGGISIGELFSNKADYSGKKVIVSGQISRVNYSIMKKNWVHIQDGTGDDSNFDLTITTLASPKVGDTVTFQGIVALDKDFGMGYHYELIIEEAKEVK